MDPGIGSGYIKIYDTISTYEWRNKCQLRAREIESDGNTKDFI